MWAAFRGIEQPFSPLLKKNLNSIVSRKRSSGDSHIGELLPGLHTRAHTGLIFVRLWM